MKKYILPTLFLSTFILTGSLISQAKASINNSIFTINLLPIQPSHGLYYKEKQADGSERHVIEKNIIVLLEKNIVAPSDADVKTIEKIVKENKKIDKANQARLDLITELEIYFNGASGNGAKNSANEPVYFKFNIIIERVADTKCILTAKALSKKHALISDSKTPSGNKLEVQAAVFTTIPTNGDFGKTSGNIIYNINIKSPEGTLSHEIGHTLFLFDNYENSTNSSDFGSGLMGAFPVPITPEEVDEIIQRSLKLEHEPDKSLFATKRQ
jgi:hypothetical protein